MSKTNTSNAATQSKDLTDTFPVVLSESHINKTRTHASTFLNVPSNLSSRRDSIDSAFSGSDITELSFGLSDGGSARDEGLLRTLSDASGSFANISAPSKWRSALIEFWIANYGAFLVLLSQVFGCAMMISTRLLETQGPHGKPMHPFQILFVRQSITAFITTSYALWSKSVPHFPLGPPGTIQLLLVTRGLFGFLGVLGLYFSLLYLPLSEATVLTFLAPIGACYAFSMLLPGETFSKKQQIAAYISLFGVVFIARPASLFSRADLVEGSVGAQPGNSTLSLRTREAVAEPTSFQRLQAVGVAMIGVVGAVGALTSIRAIGTRAHALLSVNYFSVWCTFASLVALAILPTVKFRYPENSLEWGLLSILGCCGFIMQFLLTKGMAYGGSSSLDRTFNTNRQDLELQNHQVESSEVDTSSHRGPYANVHFRESNITSAPTVKGSGAKATSMLYTQMLFALVADKIIFDVVPDFWSWVGSAFILLGAILVAADNGKRKFSSERSINIPRQESPARDQHDVANNDEGVGLLEDPDSGSHLQDTTFSSDSR